MLRRLLTRQRTDRHAEPSPITSQLMRTGTLPLATACLYRYRAAIPWRNLPERFGNWKVVHQRFSRWAKSGVFKRIFQLLASDHDNEYMMIDATIVRAISTVPVRSKKASKRSADRVTD
jgi:transposase